MQPEAVIFDIGNVLTRWQPEAFYDRVIGEDRRRALFDRTYVSGALGLMKPDPAIYRAVEQDCGLPPESLLFTDDKAENTAAAAVRGWKVHLFDGWQGLAGRLVDESLLTPAEAGL